MRKTKTLLAATSIAAFSGALSGSGCGIPMEEYDARVSELRKAEDRLKGCGESVQKEQQRNSETTQGLEELRGQIRLLQGQRSSGEEKAALQKAQAEAAREKQAEADRKADHETLARNLKEELEAGVVVLEIRKGVLRMVIPEEALFSSGSSSLGPPGKKVLDAVAREVKLMPPRQLLVAAYVDRGPKSKPKEDLSLTVDRAKKVSEYLVKQGVEPERLAAAGFGEAEPIADNGNEDARSKNRRLEVELLGPVTLSSPSAPTASDKKPAEPSPAQKPQSEKRETEARHAQPEKRETQPPPVAREAPAPLPPAVRIPPAPVTPPSGSSVDDPGL